MFDAETLTAHDAVALPGNALIDVARRAVFQNIVVVFVRMLVRVV
jgi:hypothetical protein